MSAAAGAPRGYAFGTLLALLLLACDASTDLPNPECETEGGVHVTPSGEIATVAYDLASPLFHGWGWYRRQMLGALAGEETGVFTGTSFSSRRPTPPRPRPRRPVAG